MTIHAFIDTWRTHQGNTEYIFEVCQDVRCDKSHFISGLEGSRLVTHAWEGVLDSDGKPGK